MKTLTFTVFCLMAGTACAQEFDLNTPDGLSAAIVAASTNTSEEARHKVEINGCEMTTYVWKPWKESGMQLWSSFVFDMSRTRWSSADDPPILIASDGRKPGSDGEGMVLIFFEMPLGQSARHEIPDFRVKPQEKVEPSPREDYVPFFYRPSKKFFIMHEGPGVVDKATRFTRLYERYVAEYCAVFG